MSEGEEGDTKLLVSQMGPATRRVGVGSTSQCPGPGRENATWRKAVYTGRTPGAMWRRAANEMCSNVGGPG